MTGPAEPGYCDRCGSFRLVTPVPGSRGGACHDCVTQLEPDPEPCRHVCNTGDRLKPGHPEYRQCSCGQWYRSGGGYWYRVSRPPQRWLREHGMDPGEFWATEDDGPGPRLFGDFAFRRPGLLMFLRWLFRD